ncbi:MAG: DUF2116 family Zn-ribbon domain-containing protein [Thaumarchaeota archaeon]|nr:DUF2116 family Zn-ribbon domain-containing protein [Candidatus Calditenuaceae archaeon]MDW8042238.1 DUF2116 family Zn-ribbon domain-containing protein [Nitrososphaerota archaeon]
MSVRPAAKRSRIPEHKHCPICGLPMAVDADFCGESCRKTHEERLRRERRARNFSLLMYIAIMLMLFLFLFVPPLLQR